jgi:ketosteroid isomerase-like protein
MTTQADDVVAIQNLKAGYCAAVDSLTGDKAAAAEAFRAIFMPDVVADYGFDPILGAEALADFLCNAIAGSSEWRIHMIHSPMVAVTGDRATGDWTVAVHLQRIGGQVDLLLGRYADVFRRTAEGWRIASVRFLRRM